MTRIPPFALAALLGATLPVPAQAPQAKTPDPATVRSLMSAAENEPDPAVLKAMKSQVFVIRHRNAGQLADLLRPLASGIKGAGMSSINAHDGFNALSVRDFPENLAAIGAAIQRLDVPVAVEAAQNVELHIQVLFASRAPVSENDLPPDLQKVLATLKGTLAYRGFTPVASFVQRVQVEGRQNHEVSGTGVVDSRFIDLEGAKTASDWRVFWWASQPSMSTPKEGPARFDLKGFGMKITENGAKGSQTLADFSTSLGLKEGETVVVGTSVVKNHGLIVVVSAKRVQ
ncbi:MAG: hypothetical protein KGI56_01590 [Acidobacteriota bacterium]|nr:hypothetical protein [Acidobacteriota bacterium]